MDITQHGLLLIALLSNLASIVFSVFDATGTGGLFNNSINSLTEKYYEEVTPAGIVFGTIWPIIYVWNIAGIVYLVASVKLPTDQSPVNMSPTLISKGFLVFYSIGFLSTVAWLFAYDRESLELSFVALLLGVVSVGASLGISYKLVYDNLAKLEMNSQGVLWLMRILVQNGLALFNTWLTVASAIGFCELITYKDSPAESQAALRGFFTEEDASTLTLSLVLSIIVTWFIMENFVWQKYCQYTLTVYPVYILALAGLVGRLQNEEDATRNLLLAAIALGVAILAFLARIAITVYRLTPPNQKYKDDCQKLKLHMYE
ncbi:uncharacterized protein LOC143460178 isoform X3 [Clavelina lepadiformis]|uniref:uncharacterized protein LOC143460178 isoform X3 n=1 Tax=Clavelina lepadiformis TaxID=159417 RepID=UPI0040414540